MAALVVALAVAAYWAWGMFGTSIIADREARQALAEFSRSHPVPSDAASAELYTDFDAFPPPLVTETSGVWGTLWVPSWAGTTGVYGDDIDARLPIREGTTSAVLATGAAGHYTDTALPGQVGNFALAGHRRTYGDNFLHLDKLVEGDWLVVETPEAWFVYRVTTHQIVDPGDVAVVAPVPGHPGETPTSGRYITLTTCHSLSSGEWGNDHRLVVHGELTGWLEHERGIPPQLAG